MTYRIPIDIEHDEKFQLPGPPPDGSAIYDSRI